MLSQEHELDHVNTRRTTTVAAIVSILLIVVTTVTLGRQSHPSTKDYFSSGSSSNPHTYSAQLKRLKSLAQHVEERNGPDGSSSVIEIRDEDVKKFCYGEFEGMEQQKALSQQLYLEMQHGATTTRNAQIVSLTYQNRMNLLSVAADATSMTDFEQSVIFGGVGGTSFEWMPVQTFVNFQSSASSGYIGKIRFEAGIKADYIQSATFGTSGNMHSGYGRVYGCFADVKIWSDTMVRGLKAKFCRAPPLTNSGTTGVLGYETGSSAWAFGTGCSQCGSSTSSRRCIVGVRGRAGAGLDQISFVQACTDLW